MTVGECVSRRSNDPERVSKARAVFVDVGHNMHTQQANRTHSTYNREAGQPSTVAYEAKRVTLRDNVLHTIR